jgi:hypothetical protein
MFLATHPPHIAYSDLRLPMRNARLLICDLIELVVMVNYSRPRTLYSCQLVNFDRPCWGLLLNIIATHPRTLHRLL